MKGLMKKDFLTIRKKYGVARVIVDLIIIVAMFFILENDSVIYISFLLLPLEIASMISTLQLNDEQWKWNRYAIAMPISKQNIVKSRYAVALIIALLGTLISIIINTVAYIAFSNFSLKIYLLISCVSFFIMLLFLLLMIPSNYSRGVNAGVVVMILLIGVILAINFINKVMNISIFGNIMSNLGISLTISFVAILLLWVLSYHLSTLFFKRKYV